LTAAFPTDDPTALWPADRPQVKLGRLEVVGVRRPPSVMTAAEHLTTATTMCREMEMTYWLDRATMELKDLA